MPFLEDGLSDTTSIPTWMQIYIDFDASPVCIVATSNR